MRRALIALLLMVSAGLGAAAAQDASASQPASLFTLVKSVAVTPSGNYTTGDFVRIAYVPGRQRFILTFSTLLKQLEGGCARSAYAYKEYTADMVDTGNAGVISCHALTDTGGLIVGDDLYLASTERHDNVEGWTLARFNAVTWEKAVEFWYPLTDPQMMGGDPLLASVNGEIDVSSVYVDDPNGAPPNSLGTHHHFFTTALQFASKRTLRDTPHTNLNGMIVQGGLIHLLSSTRLIGGDLVVMRYSPGWTFVDVKILRQGAATPMGVQFDGSRFYVAYTTQQLTDGHLPFVENVHLAAFDTNWNLLDDVALTTFVLADQVSSIHPWLALKDNRLYVTYCQNAAGQGPESMQAYVKVYEISTAPLCTSFTISPSSLSVPPSAGSQTVTLTGVPAACVGGAWTASTSASWLSVSPSSGTGPGPVLVSWTATSGSSRAASVTLGGSTLSVSQSAGTSRKRRAVAH